MPRLVLRNPPTFPGADAADARAVRDATPRGGPTARRVGVVDKGSAVALGRLIKQLRVARGLTQSDVAGVELTKQLVSQIETGRTRPSSTTLGVLAKRLATTPESVLALLPARLPSPPSPAEVSYAVRRVEALLAVGDHTQADELLMHLQETGLSQLQAATVARLRAEATLRRGDASGALEAALAAARLAAESGDTGERVLAANLAGRAAFRCERFAAALQHFDDAVSMAPAAEAVDPALMARLLTNRGNAWWRVGDRARAVADLEAAKVAAEGAEDLRQLAIAHMGLGETARDGGDWATAVKHIERAVALFERLEERQLLVQNLHNLGEVHGDRGDVEEARRLHERARRAAVALGDGRTEGYALERLAALDLGSGDTSGALRQATRATKLARECGDSALLVEALATLADAREAHGESRAAERGYAEAVAVAEEAGAYSHRRVLIRRGELEQRRGDVAAAAVSFRSAALLR